MISDVTPSDILESLLVSTHRLTRLAGTATGSTVPSATWRTLAILEAEGPMRVGELAAASRITQPGMTRLLAGLVETEYVSRIADVDDSRAWLIAATDKGRLALADWRRVLGDELAPRFAGLDDDDWAALRRTAEILASRTATDAAMTA
jgi:DNA-binding MarR family transcriptional regulator